MSNLGIGAFLLACVGVALVMLAYGPTLMGNPPWPTPIPAAAQGEPKTGRVSVANDFGTYCGATENLAREAVKQRQSHNTASIDQWMRDGNLWFLVTDTRVTILRTLGDVSEVQAITGEHFGRVCWVPAGAIRS